MTHSNTLTATRRQAAIYRKTLEEILRMALKQELIGKGDKLSWELLDLVGSVLGKYRPHGAQS